MSDIKKKVKDLNPFVQPRDLAALSAQTITGNVYEALCVISKRANQVSVELKQELQSKLEEFASVMDSLEEVQENKEQIEISKFYERLPNPVTIATNEFINHKLIYRYDEDPKDEL